MAADISAYIQAIELASRGEDVRDSLVGALNGINNSIAPAVVAAVADAAESGEFDGRSITGTTMNDDYTLTFTFSDGTSYTTESLRGADGDINDLLAVPVVSAIRNSDYIFIERDSTICKVLASAIVVPDTETNAIMSESEEAILTESGETILADVAE